MSLKQSIVIVNEFSIKTGKTTGTRGGTPGFYITRYMLREGATEDLTPVRFDDADSYIMRYMARQDATETMDSVGKIKEEMRRAQGAGGVAFGAVGKYDIGDISMSHHKIKRVSNAIQDSFDEGKTVLKTILSFDLDYLREMGIVDKEFVMEKQGDFRGNIDQMKMRRAIMDGMEKLGNYYDDLAWVGIVQVDTKHVHAHLAMVDMGTGILAEDGTQKGKLNSTHMRALRRGIDNSLHDMNPIKMMSSSITYGRRNVRCFIKKYTHETMAQHGVPQFLLATLPTDKRLWRASTNRKEMQKPNEIVREFVEEVLRQDEGKDGSGYKEVLRSINEYATQRSVREGLTGAEERHLMEQGRVRLVDDCINSVYAVLKQLPDEAKPVRTPMMDAMSMSYDVMASKEIRASDPMVEFGFKLRSYSSRLNHHKQQRHVYRNAAKNYEKEQEKDKVAIVSKPLYDFYCFEESYHAMLLAKYQHFLSFLPNDEKYEDEFEKLMQYRDRMTRLKNMMNDPSCKRMSPESAEDYGRKVYDLRGGEFVSSNPDILDRRLDFMSETYANMEDGFRIRLADYGLTLEEDGEGRVVSTEKPYAFDDVKALDLHHLVYDFPYDVPISKLNVDQFVDVANHRYTAYNGAIGYLKSSDQAMYISNLPGRDVQIMKDFADQLSDDMVLRTVLPPAGDRTHSGKTVRLGQDYTTVMRLAVQATVNAVQIGE